MVLQGGSPFCRLPSKVKATKARSFARMELVSRCFILLFSLLMEGCVRDEDRLAPFWTV